MISPFYFPCSYVHEQSFTTSSILYHTFFLLFSTFWSRFRMTIELTLTHGSPKSLAKFQYRMLFHETFPLQPRAKTTATNCKKEGVQSKDGSKCHPSQYYSQPSTFNFRVMTRSDELVLLLSHPSTYRAHLYRKIISLLSPFFLTHFSYFLLYLGLLSTGALNDPALTVPRSHYVSFTRRCCFVNCFHYTMGKKQQ